MKFTSQYYSQMPRHKTLHTCIVITSDVADKEQTSSLTKIQICDQLYFTVLVYTVFLSHACFHPGDSIFKMHFFTPNFSPPGAGGCYDTKVCMCHGEHVTHHNPPLIYDLFHDPSESRPLSPDTEPRYAEILEETTKAVERHQSTLTDSDSHANTHTLGTPCQMTWEKILWRPWLQPCCGTFPFCGCKENATHT